MNLAIGSPRLPPCNQCDWDENLGPNLGALGDHLSSRSGWVAPVLPHPLLLHSKGLKTQCESKSVEVVLSSHCKVGGEEKCPDGH